MKKRYLVPFIFIICMLISTTIFASYVIFEPDVDSGYVTEYYIDMYGNEIKSETKTYVNNNKYTMKAPDIDGYVCYNARVNDDSLYYKQSDIDYNNGVSITLSSFDSDGDYVIFLYTEDEYNSGYADSKTFTQDITINYYNYSTGKIMESETYEDEKIGENFVFEPDTNITYSDDKYTFVKSQPSVNSDTDDVSIFVSKDDEDNEINLYYREGKSTDRYITIYHIDVDNNEEFDEDIISGVKVGEDYTYSVTSKGGYTYLSSSPKSSGIANSITIEVQEDNDDNVIYCYYKKNSTNDTTDWYDDNNKYYVSPTDTFYNNTYTGTSTVNNTNTDDNTYYIPIRSDGISVNTMPYYNFVSGYANNYFMPNNYITRAEAAQLFYNIASDKSNGNIKYTFKDLNSESWYYNPIYFCCSNGIMNGYTDQTVRPNSYITRAEFIKMAVEVAGFEDENTPISFTDVKMSDWYYSYVKAGVQLGLLDGYSDGTFRPNNNITRAEATKIIDTIVGRTIAYDDIYKDVYYKDVKTSDWSYPYIKMANGISK